MKTISSKDLAARFGLNSAQLRKDLAYFGEFGIRGMGYPITTLKEQILHILGLTESAAGTKTWKAIVIGAGRIGTALLKFQDFLKYGFEVLAAFDKDLATSEYAMQKDAELVETSVPLLAIEQLESFLADQPVDIAILAVPEDDAQDVANRLVSAGIRAILNFVPVQLLVPSEVKVRSVDLMAEFQSLTYHLNCQEIAGRKQKNEESAAL